MDAGSVAVLREPLVQAIDEHGGRVVLDLAPLSFLDSTGLGLLVSAHRRAAEVGGELRLAQPSQAIQRVLHVTGLDQVVAIFATAEEATAAPTTALSGTP